VNSPRDDYGFIYNSKENIGYLTSTRSGGRGNEDIWMVTKKWKDDNLASKKDKLTDNSDYDRYNDEQRPNEYFTPADLADRKKTEPAAETGRLHVLVTDQRGIAIPDAEVDLSDCYGTKGVTGSDGKFYFDELMRTIDCSILLRKRGYQDVTLALRDFGKKSLKVSLSNDSREVFRGYVFDARSNVPVRGVTVRLQLADGEIETTTDEAGFYTLNVEPGLTYLVTYSKYAYNDKVVRTNFPYNSNNRIADVLLTKTEDARRTDDYVTYPARPTEHNDQTGTTTVFKRETTPERVVTPERPKTVIPECDGYSVQLAAMPNEPSDAKLRQYEALTNLGNVYVKTEGRNKKIRLGIYKTEMEAMQTLRSVQKNVAYRDAFVVQECGADKTLVISTESPAPVAHNADLASKGNVSVRYGVQLGSFAQNRSINISDYTRLNGIGNLYSRNENGYTKVRLGVWANYADAEAAKAEVIRKGFPDATIVTERGDDPEIRDYLISPPPTKTEAVKPVEPVAPVVYNTTPNAANPFYVRIAALSKPEQFDAAPLEGLGFIEKRKSANAPGMTVILLGSYPDQSTAAKVASKLVSMGYPDAHVVKDEKGKLVRK
jgi:cell division septation protein DedD